MTNLTLTMLCIITFVTAWRLTGIALEYNKTVVEVSTSDGRVYKFHMTKRQARELYKVVKSHE